MSVELKKSYTGHPYVPYWTFAEYSERFKDFFSMELRDGVLMVKHHEFQQPDKSACWQYGLHKGWGQLFKLIGQDPEIEVLIISGTGEKWLDINIQDAIKLKEVEEKNPVTFVEEMYPMYRDGSDLVFNTVFDLHIPTIGIINGPAPGHTEFPLLMDITLMADDAVIQDPHFSAGYVPGDGQHLINHFLGGYKTANYLAYFGKALSAETALKLNLVNEVHTRSNIWDRAWELAELIMKQPRHIRRMTHDLIREPLREEINRYFEAQFALEWWGCAHKAGIKGQDNFAHMQTIVTRDKNDIQ